MQSTIIGIGLLLVALLGIFRPALSQSSSTTITILMAEANGRNETLTTTTTTAVPPIWIPSTCPERCTCKPISDAAPRWLKVKCGGSSTNKIISLKELDLASIRSDVQHL